MPVRHRLDFKQALSTLRQLKDQEDAAHQQRWTQSNSSSWWNWQETWWHSSYEHHHEDVPSTDWSGKPDRKVIGPLNRGMILRINLLKYSSKVGNSWQQFTVTNWDTSNTERWLRKFYMKTMDTVYELWERSEWELQHHKWNWTDAYTNKQTRKQNTNDDVHFEDRVARHALRICSTVVIVSYFTLHGQVLSSFTVISIPSNAPSPWLASPPSTSSSSCLSPSSSSTSSCPMSSSTRSAWQTTCAAPLQKRERTPWTSSTPSRLKSQESINLERKSYLECSSEMHCARGEFGRVTCWLQT